MRNNHTFHDHFSEWYASSQLTGIVHDFLYTPCGKLLCLSKGAFEVITEEFESCETCKATFRRLTGLFQSKPATGIAVEWWD